ncbi:hypothetical protein BKI52_41895 [marine bacterium AO1-C]|nr:hypothetical protein BKI52_41895 [marine bacterium AO1-C]
MQKFIHKLLQLEIEEKGYSNLVFSPLSLEMLLGMALPGTQGKSREELLQALEISEEEVNSYLATLQTASESLLAIQPDRAEEVNFTKVQLANSLWHRGDIRPNAHYERTISTRFPLELFPFSDPIEATTERINQWANDKTNGLIPELPITLDQDSVAVLLNALYLKAFWSKAFDSYPQDTDVFHLLDGREVTAQYMEIRQDTDGNAQAYYLKKDTFHALRFMCNDQRIGLEVYLPYENTGLDHFINNIQPNDFNQWKEEFIEAPYFYFLLPKFEVNGSFKLKEVASKLGIAALFQLSKDLTPLLASKEPLKVTEIAQEARIKIKEEGLEAAAVTFLAAVAGSAFFEEPERQQMIVFEANHPFLYRIVDTITDKTLFQGIFTQPKNAPNVFLNHLNTRLLKEYKQKTQQLTDSERLVLSLILVEQALNQHPLKHNIIHTMIDDIWQNLALEINHRNQKVPLTYREYMDFLDILIENGLEEDNWNHSADHIDQFKAYKELVDQKILRVLNSFIIGFDTLVSLENNQSLHYFLEAVVEAEVQLPHYEKTIAIIKKSKQNDVFQRTSIKQLTFDDLPTEIVYTEEEKQQRAATKARQTLENTNPNLEKFFKIGWLNYAFSMVVDQFGGKYHFLRKLVDKIWEYIQYSNPSLKSEIAIILTWITESDTYQNHPLIDTKDKIYFRLFRKKYAKHLLFCKLWLKYFETPAYWDLFDEIDWQEREPDIIDKAINLVNVELGYQLPNFTYLFESFLKTVNQESNLVLDYNFFDNLAKNISTN